MERSRLRRLVYSVFSDTVMIFLALLVIPVFVADFFHLSPVQGLIITILDWIIYSFFLLEFLLKFYIDRLGYVRTHRLDSAISLIIILSPLLVLLSPYFIATPALRLVRLSRLLRLVAVGVKARRSWRQINLKSYAIVAIVIAFGFMVSFFRNPVTYTVNDIAAFVGFIQIIGVLYAIITGFMIFNVWGRHSALDNAIRKETLAIQNVYLLSLQLKQGSASNALKKAILGYTDKIINIYWKTRGDVSATKDEFEKFFVLITRFSSKTQRQHMILEDMNDELRNASSYRTDAVSLILSRTSIILWTLLMVLSITLIISFLAVNFASQLFATITITLLSTAIAIITVIIYDMDYPFHAGFWIISPEAYFELEDFIKAH
ncbi:MAG: DUF4239 domain-containing protein [Candidatus Micrarchaeota archaeon]|nr:DUF4239 domain-containing protein [Candidatus Micrarchaeota archaeon]MDE1824678.1 DUF4239 domain-containing protein [Candidatus Micrarchaeota archaeon]MDE1849886.1 DUF4239 domain-containing protein [Candidatus Micrarchaeota archaeon]